MADSIVRIRTPRELHEALILATTHMRNIRPDRLLVSPLQAQKLREDMPPKEWWIGKHGGLTAFFFMGVQVVEGAADQQPEFVWSAPVEKFV